MEVSQADSVGSIIRGIIIPSLPTSSANHTLNGTAPALVFGHADADGHLAAEQTRTNLEATGIVVERVIVAPETKNYRFWEQAFSAYDFTDFGLVAIVDIAFSFSDPDNSLEAVLQVTDNHPRTQFIVVDHHALKQPAMPQPNLRLVEVRSVYDCCVGVPTDELMVVAAICDGDGKAVRSRTTVEFKKRAIGIRRAAADSGIAGSRLLSLIHWRRWEYFEALADEPADSHMSARGRRRACSSNSPMLEAARAGAI